MSLAFTPSPETTSFRSSNSVTGALSVVWFYLQRDRFLLPLWVLSTLGALLGGSAIVGVNYATEQARQNRYDQLQELPMFLLFQGKAFGATLEALAVQQAFGGTTLLAAAGAALLVIRNTRAEEEHGRRELLGSLAIGRNAPLVAAVTLVLVAGLCIGILSTLGMISLGFPAAGSMIVGGVVAGASWVGATLAALFAQFTSNARFAGVAAVVTVMFFHYLRGIGHVAGENLYWLTWLSPSGWLEGTQAYAGDRLWPFLLIFGFAALSLTMALWLSAGRDLGGGLITAQDGRLHARRSLSGVAGLAWRQNRTSFLVWAGFMVMIGISFGSAGAAAVSDYADARWLADYSVAIGLADPAKTFFVYITFVMVFPIAAYAILTILCARSEETSGIAEAVLAKPIERLRWAAGSILAAMSGSAALLIILGICLAITAPDIDGLLILTLTLIPAVWVIIAITVVAFGHLPRATSTIAWITLGIGIVGEILVKAGLPDWIFLASSPIAHANPYYAEPYTGYVLLGITTVLMAFGLWGLSRRDMPQ